MPTTARTFLFAPADHRRRLDSASEQPADGGLSPRPEELEQAPRAAAAAAEAALAAGFPRTDAEWTV